MHKPLFLSCSTLQRKVRHSVTSICSSSHRACQHLSMCPRPSYWPVGSVTSLTLNLDCILIVAETWTLIFTRDFLKLTEQNLQKPWTCANSWWISGLQASGCVLCKAVAVSGPTMQLGMNTGCGLAAPGRGKVKYCSLSYNHIHISRQTKNARFVCIFCQSEGRAAS